MKKKIKDLTFEEIISIHNLSFCNECPLKDNNGSCIRTGVTYDFNTEFLEKEIEIASPTLEQCIKEWEERGWKVEISTSTIKLDYIKFGRLSGIHIYKGLKEVRILYENLHYEEFHLLSKTIKALEKMKDE